MTKSVQHSGGAFARLNEQTVNAVLDGFPDGPGWQPIKCSSLVHSTAKPKMGWRSFKSLENVGGVYVFLLPLSEFFQIERTIVLDGPIVRKHKTYIHFAFVGRPFSLDGTDWMIAYAGRTANLGKRFRWHFSAFEKSTASQVRVGLQKCGAVKSPGDALDYMRRNSVILACPMKDPGEVANRDIVEAALIARYRPPFNIKAER